MYYQLTGAKKNMGDFLIEQRSLALLKSVKGDENVELIPRWEVPNDETLKKLSKAKAIILAGGPFYKQNVPFENKVFQKIKDLGVPIVFMGGGSKYRVCQEFKVPTKLKSTSIDYLEEVQKNAPLTCRDHVTERMLRSNGLSNVLMTGCPVWYDLKKIGFEGEFPKEIKKVVLSLPQDFALKNQASDLIVQTRKRFKDAEIYCSFNRGIEVDEHTPEEESLVLKQFLKVCEENSVHATDTSYDLKKIEFYHDCDIHIGYRVHSHIYFLSQKKPSYLISEDSRGVGVSESLGTIMAPALKHFVSFNFSSHFGSNTLNRVVSGLFSRSLTPDSKVVSSVLKEVETDLNSGFSNYKNVYEKIDQYYEVMIKFLKQLP